MGRERQLTLRVHATCAESRANGPGLRGVLWVQGCTLGCPGCFNPQTHPARAGEMLLVSDVFARLTESRAIEGVTISGGEPLQQSNAVLALLGLIKAQTDLSVVLFTGLEWAGIPPGVHRELERCCDVLIAGRYKQEQRTASGLRGSMNKEFLFLTDRYSPADFAEVPEAELFIGQDGTMELSGINPLNLAIA